MRLGFAFYLLCLLAFDLSGQVSVMSYNIRYDNPNDGPDRWEVRKAEVAELLAHYQPDIFGLQEALPRQTTFLHQQLADYQYIGFGRDGEGTDSEGAPIFYKPSRFALLHSEVLWLSETPQEISRGWDAALNRIITYGIFRDQKGGDTLHVFNCHFDHRGEVARLKSAELLVNLLTQKNLEEQRLVLLGDLNCEPQEDPMQVLLEQYKDAYHSSHHPAYGPEGTFNGFDTEQIVTGRIDYVLIRGVRAMRHRIIDDRRRNNRYPSDHFPVLVHLWMD